MMPFYLPTQPQPPGAYTHNFDDATHWPGDDFEDVGGPHVGLIRQRGQMSTPANHWSDCNSKSGHQSKAGLMTEKSVIGSPAAGPQRSEQWSAIQNE